MNSMRLKLIVVHCIRRLQLTSRFSSTSMKWASKLPEILRILHELTRHEVHNGEDQRSTRSRVKFVGKVSDER